jgi:hypothetical protein
MHAACRRAQAAAGKHLGTLIHTTHKRGWACVSAVKEDIYVAPKMPCIRLYAQQLLAIVQSCFEEGNPAGNMLSQ